MIDESAFSDLSPAFWKAMNWKASKHFLQCRQDLIRMSSEYGIPSMRNQLWNDAEASID